MKAKTFLEWFNDWDVPMYIDSYEKLQNNLDRYSKFYSQPFTVDMLTGENRLFEGWEYDIPTGVVSLQGAFAYKNAINQFLLSHNGNITVINTLNDFITLCNLSGIELTFNENKTIKELSLSKGEKK